MKGYANPGLLVTPRALAAMVDRTPVTERPLVLDLRPPDAYVAGHVPGAIHLDLWGVSLIDTDPAPLKAFMWMIEHVLAIHGVDASTPVVVYDEQSGVRAARAFWFLEYFGHPSVRVLDGGFNAWIAEGLPVTRDAGPPPKSEWTGAPRRTHPGHLEGTAHGALGRGGRRHPRHPHRRRVLRHDRAREARRRGARRRAYRVDAQPHADPASSSPPPSSSRCTPMPASHPTAR